MKAIIYARLSYARGEEISIERQVEMCKRVADARGWTPDIRIEREGARSGRFESRRPVWQAARRDLLNDPEIGALIVANLSRASRSKIGIFTLFDDLTRHHKELVSVKEGFDASTPIGRAMLGVLAVFNEWYAEESASLQQVRINEQRQRGTYMGRPPLGLTATGRGVSRHLVPDTRTYVVKGVTRSYLDTVIAWLKLYTSPQPWGVYRGATWLNAHGYRALRQNNEPGLVHPMTLHHIMYSLSRYVGFVDATLLRKATLRYQERRNHQGNRPQLRHDPLLLLGILVCAHCRRPYWQAYHVKQAPMYRHSRPLCHQGRMNVTASQVHQWVWQLLECVCALSPEQLHQAAVAAATPRQPDLAQERARLQEKRRRLEEGYIEGIIEKDTYTEQRTATLAALQQLAGASTDTMTADDYTLILSQTVDLLRTTAHQEPYLANRLMRDMFESIALDNGRITQVVRRPPFDTLPL